MSVTGVWHWRPKRDPGATGESRRATGASKTTIQRGLTELETDTEPTKNRVRAAGGGRKKAEIANPDLLGPWMALLHPPGSADLGRKSSGGGVLQGRSGASEASVRRSRELRRREDLRLRSPIIGECNSAGTNALPVRFPSGGNRNPANWRGWDRWTDTTSAHRSIMTDRPSRWRTSPMQQCRHRSSRRGGVLRIR